MIDTHIEMLLDMMMKLSGFGKASFGESVGANTSGDALGLYFTPTTRFIQHQQIAQKAFYESINWKILKFYDTFMTKSSKIELGGGYPRSTYLGVSEGDGLLPRVKNIGRGQNNVVTKGMIDGKYYSQVTFPPATPKDEIALKRLLFEAGSSGFLSKDTAFEEWGLDSPQDEIEKLRTEQADPDLNPEGQSQLSDAQTNANSVELQGQQQMFDQEQSLLNPQQPAGQGQLPPPPQGV